MLDFQMDAVLDWNTALSYMLRKCSRYEKAIAFGNKIVRSYRKQFSMGVDYFTCACCNEVSNDHCDHTSCECCGGMICEYCMPDAKQDGLAKTYDGSDLYLCGDCEIDAETEHDLRAIAQFLLKSQKKRKFNTIQEVRSHLREKGKLPPAKFNRKEYEVEDASETSEIEEVK